MTTRGLIIRGALAILVLVTLSSTFYTVSEQEQVVITQCGEPIGQAIASPGLHVKIPFTQDVNVFTETGMLVWKEKSRDVSDICRNRRHDFFMYDLIKLPPSLTIGRYIVKVTIVDRNANRIAEKTVPVEIVAGDSQ